MAKRVDDWTREFAAAFVNRKYVAHADERQKILGLSYVTAEKEDLIDEVASFVRYMVAHASKS